MAKKRIKILKTKYVSSSGNLFITCQGCDDNKEEILCVRALDFLFYLGINAIPKQEMPSDFFDVFCGKVINLDMSKDPEIPDIKELSKKSPEESAKIFNLLNEYPDLTNEDS